MRYLKRILPLLLVIAMLSGILLPVAAQEAQETLSLNEQVQVSVDWDNTKMFTFIPETDGYYVFESSDYDSDPKGYVYDADENTIVYDDDGGSNFNFSAGWFAYAGVTYYLEAAGEGSYTVSVKNLPRLTLDEAVQVNAADGIMKYYFIPEQSGWYSFQSMGSDVDTIGSIYTENGDLLADNDDGGSGYNFLVTYQLEAGTTYLLEVRTYNDGAEGSYQVVMTIPPMAESLTIEGETTGYAGERTYWYAQVVPSDAVVNSVRWTSSDETVATVQTTMGCSSELTLVGPGTAVVTVTVDNGVTASQVVTVLERVQVHCGEDIIVQLDDVADVYFFTPETDGWYGFYSIGDELDTYAYLSGEYGDDYDDDSGLGNNFLVKAYMRAGFSYRLSPKCAAYNEGDSFIARIEPLTAPTGLELSKQSLSLKCGDDYHLWTESTPMLSWTETVIWESSAPSVATVTQDGYIQCLASGTTVITAATESGLSASCTVTVTDIPVVDCGQVVEPNLQDYECRLKFIPESDGWYCFDIASRDLGYSYSMGGEDFDSQCKDDHNYKVAYLEAGETYIFYIGWEDYGDSAYIKMQVFPLTETAQSITLDRNEIVGYSGAWYYLEAELAPLPYIPEEVNWTSSDETVAYVSQYGSVELLSAGTAVITVTTESGLSASCMVTVKEEASITCGQVVTPELSDNTCSLRFIPETDGWYCFYSTGRNIDPWGCVRDHYRNEIASDDDGGEDNQFMVRVQLEAGQTYYLESDWNAYEGSSLSLQIVALTQRIESLTLSRTQITDYPNTWYDIETTFEPIWSIPEEITWTSSDEAVADVAQYGGVVALLSAGTAVITATTESGVSASCTVTVREYATITCDQPVFPDLSEKSCEMKFVPETDGWYGFYSVGSGGSVWGGTSADNEHDSRQNGQFMIKAYFVAGETYFLYASWEDYQGDLSLHIAPLTESITSITLDKTEITGFAGEERYLEYFVDPLMSIPEEVTWQSSNKTVARVSQYGTVELISAGTAVITVTTESGLRASCTVTVKEIPTVTCGQVVEPKLQDYSCRLRFVPETDGWYCLDISVGSLYGYWCGIMDVDTEIEHKGNHRFYKAWLSAGEEYILYLGWDDYGSSAYIKMQIFPLTETAQSITLSYTEINGFVGDEKYLDCSFEPELCIPEELTWQSSDETVAVVNRYGTVELIGVGTAVITVTTESGLSASCPVKVKDKQTIFCGQPLQPDLDDVQCRLEFTPETDGWYAFYSTGSNVYTWGDVLSWVESYKQTRDGKHFVTYLKMTAGETYTLHAGWDAEDNSSLFLHMVLLEETMQSITLDDTYIKGYPGVFYELNYSFQPLLSIPEEVTWQSSDETVATVDRNGYVELLSSGTAVITVTTESGLSDSCYVVVPDVTPITCNQVMTHPGGKRVCLEFRPKTDGWYAFYSTGATVKPYVSIHNRYYGVEYEEVAPGDSNVLVKMPLDGGEVYYLYVDMHEQDAATATMQITSLTEQATALTLDQTEITQGCGERAWLQATLQPLMAVPEAITWTSSNDAVATVNQYGTVETHSVGTAVITATTESGISTSCTVTVKPTLTVTCGQVIKLEKQNGVFQFIPETSGWYGLHTTAFDGSVWSYIEDDGDWSGLEHAYDQTEGTIAKVQLTAGKVYYFEYGRTADCKIIPSMQIVALTKPVQSLALDETEYVTYPNQSFYLSAVCKPMQSTYEAVSWRSSNEAVATVDQYGNVETHSVGTAVITATTESGISNSCTVTVKPIPTVTCGQIVKPDMKDGIAVMQFVPQHDGWYRFEGTVTGDVERAWAGIYNQNWKGYQQDSTQWKRNMVVEYPMEAGQTYYLQSTWLADGEGSLAFKVTAIDQEQTGVTVSGAVTTFSDGQTTLELINANGVVHTTTVDGKTGSFSMTDVAPGTYTLRVSKQNHVTREYTVTVGAVDQTCDVKIHMIGDVDGNGKINIGDVAKISAHLKATGTITDAYMLLCANVNGGKLNMGDTAALYAHVRGTKRLY